MALHSHTTRDYYVGVDLGQAADPTALAIVERATTHPGTLDNFREIRRQYAVRHLERFPLGMSYVDQAARVASILGRAPLSRQNTRLVVDATGVGRPVVDLFRRAGLSPIAVTITAGDGETQTPDGWRVSKLLLVSRLQAMLHAGELRIAKALPEAQALVKELQDFRVSYTETGYASFGARVGAHDDLVLALAIAVWAAERASRSGARIVPFRI